MFLVFRFLNGASTFMILAAVPILMNELVPSQFRGALVDLHGVLLVFGYVIQSLVGYGLFFWDSPQAWRITLAIQCFWPVCLLVVLPWLPESPRWLCLQDRTEEAHKILVKLHTNKSDPEHKMAEAEFYQIRKQIIIDRTLGSSWMDIFRKPSYRKRAWLTIGTTGIIQCSGVLVINNYGPSLYKNLGYGPAKSLLYSAGWLIFAWGMNICGMFLIDRFPRPKYMAFGVAGCMMTLILEAALVANFVPSDNTAALQACIFALYFFQVFYGAMLDGTQFSYLGEMWPTNLRSKGICLGVSMISLMNIMWLQAAPTAFATIKWKFYLCFIIPGSIGAIVMFFLFPDTRGLPLEEVAALFGDKDEVAVFQTNIDVDEIESERRHGSMEKQTEVEQVER